MRGGIIENTRAWIRARLNDVFPAAPDSGKLERSVRVEEFTQPGDPLRLDYAYRYNGTRGFIHAVALSRDPSQAKVLAYTADCIRARAANSEFTAITEVEPARENPRHQFIARLLEDQRISMCRWIASRNSPTNCVPGSNNWSQRRALNAAQTRWTRKRICVTMSRHIRRELPWTDEVSWLRSLASAAVAAAPLSLAEGSQDAGAQSSREYYELRRYHLLTPQRNFADDYFRNALVPGLNRLGFRRSVSLACRSAFKVPRCTC